MNPRSDGVSQPHADVVLVSMPFGPLLTPSIALGLLGARLRAEGVSTRTLYLTLPFAKWIGADLYSAIATGEPGNHFLLGEWLFRDTLFRDGSMESSNEYLSLLQGALTTGSTEVLQRRWPDFDSFTTEVRFVRSRTQDFIQFTAARVLEFSPRIVGFTSVFQQQVSSLALAAEIKRRTPGITIVFGGANCEAVMGLEVIKQFPQVDYVISGEGDEAFPDLVRNLLKGEDIDITGVLHRKYSAERLTTHNIRELDKLPYPAYDDYFSQLQEWDLRVDTVPRLLFETSRGCWWGEKQHCTFCGLNGTSMAFRSKSATRAFDELLWMTSAYPGHPVSVVDNILDMRYFRDLVPRLSESRLDVELFYEVKANLKKEQVRLLRAANVTRIQPGVESLHDSILTLMRKGVSALQNIQLLKWCAELGISPHWNFIWGFPNEDPGAYAEMARIIPFLRHLPAPKSTSSIRLDRFSPNFNDANKLGIRDVRPFPVYDFIYPFTDEVKANLAYYFTFSYANEQDTDAYTSAFLTEVRRWQNNNARYQFFYFALADKLTLWDFRDLGLEEDPLIVLTPLQTSIYLTCDSARSATEICGLLGSAIGATQEQVMAELERMEKRRLMLEIGGRYLSLAVPWGEYAPSADGLVRMQSFIQSRSGGSSDKEESVIDLSPYALT